jgi:hypothetical protein
MPEAIPSVHAFTLRAISVTERGWISHTATTMEDDSEMSLRLARAENLMNLHSIIAKEPAGFALRIPTTWSPPSDDMKVTVRETIIKQDLMTGKNLGETDVDDYEILYAQMGA